MESVSVLKDGELLSVLLGDSAANELKGRSLRELFGLGSSNGQRGHEVRETLALYGRAYTAETRLSAARELLIRALGEQLGAGSAMSSPRDVREYLRLRLCGEEKELFLALWLDTQHRLIAAETLSTGTLTQTSVYPREAVKSALRHNAAGVIFAHNHPSGISTPSHADESLTTHLQTALRLMDVRLLDHMVVGANEIASFAELGLI